MASGDTLAIHLPSSNEPPSTNFATLDLRNLHPVLDFDTTTGEDAVFSGIMPRVYAGTTGVTVYIHYSMSTATTGTCGWLVSFERIGDQQLDVDADSFAATNTVTAVTVPATSGNVDIVNVTFTDGADMDSVAVGELYRIKITRDVASDTAAGDAELHAVEIKETQQWLLILMAQLTDWTTMKQQIGQAKPNLFLSGFTQKILVGHKPTSIS